MTQTDMNVANGSGAVVRADINAHLEALVDLSTGATAPTTTFSNMWWADTSTNILKRRNNANTAWISVMSLVTGLIIGTDIQAFDSDLAAIANNTALGSILDLSSNGVYLGTAAAANLLDDYEEGTWTPVVSDASTGGNTATGTFTGTYTKVGRKVLITVSLINIDTSGMTAGNDLHIQGVPFTSAAGILNQGSVRGTSITFADQMTAILNANNSFMRIWQNVSGASGIHLPVSAINSGASDIYATLQYTV